MGSERNLHLYGFSRIWAFVGMDVRVKELLKDFQELAALVPALLGGIVDYLNKITRGSRKWSLCGFVVHIVSALFFGWMCGALAAGLGYKVGVIAGVGGIGGFLGVRVADLLIWRVLGTDRRKQD